MSTKDRKRRYKSFSNMYYVSVVGIQFPVAIALGFFFGRWLDGLFGTWPWLTSIFSFFGIAAGFVNLFKMTADAARAEALEAEETARQQETAPSDEGDDASR